jgi:deoxyribodipyrimidine photo-lyase
MPLVDALMREMNQTGFMPNRGRMVVACYLTMDLKQDWRYGAHYFEEKLIDHDVASNYGGWNFSSGIGPGRVLVFNSLTQSLKFDKEGQYIKTWCPELKALPATLIHSPWNMPADEKEQYASTGYPEPIDCPKYTDVALAKKQRQEHLAQRAKERTEATGAKKTT